MLAWCISNMYGFFINMFMNFAAILHAEDLFIVEMIVKDDGRFCICMPAIFMHVYVQYACVYAYNIHVQVCGVMVDFFIYMAAICTHMCLQYSCMYACTMHACMPAICMHVCLHYACMYACNIWCKIYACSMHAYMPTIYMLVCK